MRNKNKSRLRRLLCLIASIILILFLSPHMTWFPTGFKFFQCQSQTYSKTEHLQHYVMEHFKTYSPQKFLLVSILSGPPFILSVWCIILYPLSRKTVSPPLPCQTDNKHECFKDTTVHCSKLQVWGIIICKLVL